MAVDSRGTVERSCPTRLFSAYQLTSTIGRSRVYFHIQINGRDVGEVTFELVSIGAQLSRDMLLPINGLAPADVLLPVRRQYVDDKGIREGCEY